MEIDYSKKFIKQFDKLRSSEQGRFLKQLEIFKKNNFDPRLRNHQLHGEYAGMRSIDVGGDLRAIYTKEGTFVIIFVQIGTHHQLYGK